MLKINSLKDGFPLRSKNHNKTKKLAVSGSDSSSISSDFIKEIRLFLHTCFLLFHWMHFPGKLSLSHSVSLQPGLQLDIDGDNEVRRRAMRR